MAVGQHGGRDFGRHQGFGQMRPGDGQHGGQMPYGQSGRGQDGQTMPYGQGGQGWGDNGASPHGWDQDGDQGNGQQGQPYAPGATPYPSATPLSQ